MTCMIPCTRVLSIPSFRKERGMMSRQYKRIQLPLVGTIFLCLLAIVYLGYLVAFGGSLYTYLSVPPETIIEHTVDTNPGIVIKHWTAANMRHATDADQQNGNASAFTPGNLDQSLGQAAQQEGQPPLNGEPSYPLSTVGKVFFTN